jgi:hypothetical protein
MRDATSCRKAAHSQTRIRCFRFRVCPADPGFGGAQSAYDTFGSAATGAARLQAEAETQRDPSSGVLGGAILDCLVVPVAESIGAPKRAPRPPKQS